MESRQTTRADWVADEGPPPGWERLDASGAPRPRVGPADLWPLLSLLDGLRRALPAELQSQFTALIRELLLTLRAVIDWYLERLDSGPPEPRIEDIPID